MFKTFRSQLAAYLCGLVLLGVGAILLHDGVKKSLAAEIVIETATPKSVETLKSEVRSVYPPDYETLKADVAKLREEKATVAKLISDQSLQISGLQGELNEKSTKLEVSEKTIASNKDMIIALTAERDKARAERDDELRARLAVAAELKKHNERKSGSLVTYYDPKTGIIYYDPQ